MLPARSTSVILLPKITFQFLCLLSMHCLVAASWNYRVYCSGRNYSRDDNFSRNLDRLLLSLSHSVAGTGFSNASVVDPANPQASVFGLALCRGNISADQCRDCANVIRLSLSNSTNCPNKTSGIVWRLLCFFRYSETNFIGAVAAPSLNFGWGGIIDNPERQFVDVKAFVYNLIQKCAEDDRLFATEENTQRDGTVRYGLAQCTRDLNSSECTRCLTTEIDWAAATTMKFKNWRIYSGSCVLNHSSFSRPRSLAPAAGAAATPAPAAPVLARNNGSILVIIQHGGDGTRRRIIVIAVCATIGAILVGITALFFLWKKKKRRDRDEELKRFNSQMALQMNFTGLTEEQRNLDAPNFPFKVIQAATKNFSEENELGRGGFGHVYKGDLNGRCVAIKRLSEISERGLKEFIMEVVLIAKLQHKNLVRLLGCCVDKGEKMLIYEFMPNGSLDGFLNDSEKRASLIWEKRFNIIMGIVRGLLYLHQDSRLSVIHRDLKAANVLLDEHMTAKISDFGTARTFVGDKDAKATNLIVGTYGYMAPEYISDGLFSIKSDVYSLGVLLLEIIVGQTCHKVHLLPPGYNSLIAYAWTRWNDGMASELIDSKLIGNMTDQVSDQIFRCIQIGLLCVQEDPEQRPTMSTVLNMLGSDRTLPTPKRASNGFPEGSLSVM